MRIAFVLYPDFTALDLVGPYEVISRWPDAEVRFLARSREPVRTDRGLTVLPTDTPETLPDPDMVVVPGSEKPLGLLEDRVLIDWLRAAAPGCAWTASVCTGAGLYAAAGLLEGRKTTTHWAFRDNLRSMGVDVVPEPVVFQGTHVSGAGVSAGIDMALTLTERVHGRQLAESLQLSSSTTLSRRSTPVTRTRRTRAPCGWDSACCSAINRSRRCGRTTARWRRRASAVPAGAGERRRPATRPRLSDASRSARRPVSIRAVLCPARTLNGSLCLAETVAV